MKNEDLTLESVIAKNNLLIQLLDWHRLRSAQISDENQKLISENKMLSTMLREANHELSWLRQQEPETLRPLMADRG